MPAHLFWFNRHLSRALRTVGVVVVIAFLSVLCSAAFGANPAEEMAKAGAAGGIDPKGISGLSIAQTREQLAQPSMKRRLLLGLAHDVECEFAFAGHPLR